ncbi:thiamine-phosphate kinase [Anaeromyxobacter paludicola]|uniref:Thiamine-monophosphate kinase n=1 Tax=Anaeromyxobacter paludicola TaxID=2918171 RepID=A0ABN6N8Y4_9BACT|nr:thiamine-phosphate kinase [Anaeromyxobacter paludicola]BDG09679.1 thiamine-monophosphate kinase [Anaeromyxobacter paludicola]
MTEFELIRRFTAPAPRRGTGVVLGIGDDCAVLRPPPGELLLATVDAVVEGVHFDARFAPGDVGWKALAVNLSDLAAMGARPLWALCALAVPEGADPRRLAAVGRGLAACARRHGIALAGGNVTRARELSLTVTALGSAPAGRVLRRDGARPGDVLLVSGTLGDAALGLAPGAAAALARRQRRPDPRLALGRALGPLASACIDLSDGLAQDLGHLCRASGTGARVELSRLPLSPAARRALAGAADPFLAPATGGEDYELCAAVPPGRVARALAAARRLRIPLTPVGVVTRGRAVVLEGPSGARYRPARAGHDHLAPHRRKPAF